jgi:hypothetical protein
MTVAALKRRLVPGTKLRLVHTLLGPCDLARVVADVNSVGVRFTGDGVVGFSHLRWPKASGLIETADGFEVVEGGEVAARYRWED